MPARSARLATAVGGIGFVVCFAAGATLYASGAGRSAQEISAYYGDSSRWSAQIEGFAYWYLPLFGFFAWIVAVSVVAALPAGRRAGG